MRELRDERFPELPLDCGRDVAGIVDVDEWRDWSDYETTPDQLRIEDYLDRFNLSGKSILHIGVGNSGLAQRFSGIAQAIVGTTVVESELRRARDLGLPNYRAVLHNKHSGTEAEPGPFDFIVDNNPTTFCCCITHLGAMLDFYASTVAQRGQVVTDRVGLGWTTDAPGANPRWGFDFDDLAACAKLAGLGAYRINSNIYVLARERPERPGLRASIRQVTRSIARRVSRKLKRLTRSAAK